MGGYFCAERVPLGWGAWAGVPRVTVLEATVEAWYKSCRLRRKKKGTRSLPSQLSKCVFPLNLPLGSTASPLLFTTQNPAHSRVHLGTKGNADTICSFWPPTSLTHALHLTPITARPQPGICWQSLGLPAEVIYTCKEVQRTPGKADLFHQFYDI